MKQTMRSAILAAFAMITFGATAQAESYQFDPGHTEVRFYYNHAGFTEQSGQWKIVKGSVDFDPDDIAGTKVSVTIDAKSVDTGVSALDDHLRTADFFEVETYPEITFVSTGVQQVGIESIRLTGDLTIKDKTASVTLDVTLNHQGEHPMAQFFEYYEGEWVAVEAQGDLLRSTYDVGFGAPITSDHVRLEISAEMKAGGW